MNVFFCDINGTFDHGEENRRNSVLKFVKSLLRLMKENNIDDLVFRFVTSDDIEYLLPYIHELEKEVVGSPIRLTSQFSYQYIYKNGDIKESIYNNKLDQIRHVSENCDIERIFIADNSMINQLLLRRILTITCPKSKIVSFVPGIDEFTENDMYGDRLKGINGLISSIEKYNNTISKNKSHNVK